MVQKRGGKLLHEVLLTVDNVDARREGADVGFVGGLHHTDAHEVVYLVYSRLCLGDDVVDGCGHGVGYEREIVHMVVGCA